MTTPRANTTWAPFRREVRPRDDERIRALCVSTGFFSPEELQIAGELATESVARGAAAGYHYLFADDGDALLGYSCFGAIPCTRSSYDLYWIAVSPRTQGQGLGRRLMEASEQRIAELGGTRVYVETSGRPQYAPTRGFYEACGYTVAARYEDFYAPGDDKIVFLKILA